MKKILNYLKKRFLAGLFVTIPVAATFFVVWIVFRTLRGFYNFIPNSLIKKFGTHIEVWTSSPLGDIIFGFLGLIFSIIFLILIGIIFTNFLGKKIILLWERLLKKMPFIYPVYSTAKQISLTIFSKKKHAFKKVVLIEYPRREIYCVGFLTNETQKQIKSDGKEYCNIFIPTTPNPTSGFLIIVPAEDVKILDISVEQAMKLIFSAGIVLDENEFE